MDTHSSGCFPCKWIKLRKAPKPTKQHPPEADNDGVPSKKDYVIEATKKTIDILKGAASLVGVPLVKEVLDVGLAIITTCEAINEVQERVADLKNRIAEFLLVIAKVAKDSDEKSLARLSKDVMQELQELKDCLTLITARLNKINDQNAFLTGLLPQANKKTIEDCVVAFQDGIDRFQALRGLHAAQDLNKIQEQLEDMYGLTKIMAQDVEEIKKGVHEMQSSVNVLSAMMTRTVPVGSFNPSARIPRLPDVFVGRDALVERIAKSLTSNKSIAGRVCILGPGGMGKTTTALAIMHHPRVRQKFADQHRFWVPCISANSPTGFLAILSKHLGATRQTEDTFQAVLATLEETDDPRIILLDNFETAWRPVEGSKRTVKDILEALDLIPHVSIIVTMRSEFPPLDHWLCEHLSQVNLEDSRHIYTAIDPSAKSYPELDDLLQALGHLPYAITLMAARGKRSYFNPKQLLKEWNEVGTTMLFKGDEGMDHSIQLSLNSKFVQDSTGAIELLQILSMLPAGVYYDDLGIWLKSYQSEAVDTLRDAALCLTSEIVVGSDKKIRLFVLPVIQSYMHSHDHNTTSVRESVYKACQDFLSGHRSVIKGPNDLKFKDDLAAIASQETNIQALIVEIVKSAIAIPKELQNVSQSLPLSSEEHPQIPSPTPEQLDALLTFAHYQRWTRPQMEIADNTLSLSRIAKDTRYEAEATSCLAAIFFQFDKYQDAIALYRQAGKLYAAIGDEIKALRSELDAIDATRASGDVSEPLIHLLSPAYSRWGSQPSNIEVSALLLLCKGQIHWFDRETEQALEELQEAEKLFLSVDLYLEAAECLFHISRCLARIGRYDEAIGPLDKAIQQLDLLGLGGSTYTITHYLIKTRLLKGANRWGDGMLYETLKSTLQRAQDSGTPLVIAQILEEFAEIYALDKDWDAARLAYERALKECGRISSATASSAEARCRHNLEYIQCKEANLCDDSVDFWTPYRS